ncbi:hypothetical protein Tco_0075959, partial [Tanacetum coccineum]
ETLLKLDQNKKDLVPILMLPVPMLLTNLSRLLVLWTFRLKCKTDKQRTNASRHSIQHLISELDLLMEKGMGNKDLVNERNVLIKDFQDINSRYALDMAQKAKIRWSIEGDENSKYFHGIINKKRYELAIRGVLVDGDWIEEPSKVKNEFLTHFSNLFSKPTGPSQ